MILSLDIGNSSTKWALYARDRLVEHGVEKRLIDSWLRKILQTYKVSGITVSAVADMDSGVYDALRQQGATFLDHRTNLPFSTEYQTRKTLGSDRIAAIAGAFTLYPKENILVFDTGTCITYDLVTKEGIHFGGNISPGIDLRLKAMHAFTSGLPVVVRGDSDRLLGITTEMAMQNGVVIGIVMEIEGVIRLLKSRYRGLNIILTGGDSAFFAEKLKTKIFVDPFLVLYGLYQIHQFNVGKTV